MSNHEYDPDDRNTPDLFTRLSIAMCPQDDGTRPVNPTWAGSDVSFLSPAIEFDKFPVPAGVPTQVKISIDNLGTIDASPVTLETASNVYIGSQAATMVAVQNLAIALIPAGCTYQAAVTWTPPDEFIAHACFHARVFDTYSLVHYGARCFNWDPYINPQSGSHNTILLKISDPQQAVVVTYPAINTSSLPIEPKLLVTVVDDRARFSNLDDRFPLPFVPEHLKSTSPMRATTGGAGLYPTDLGNVSARVAAGVVRGESGRVGRLDVLTGRRWPREDVNPRFVHQRYGFDVGEALNLAGGRPAMRRETFTTVLPETAQFDSYCRLPLAPGEAKLVCVVIPPAEFPPPGRRRKFQVDYQTWDERPVQNFIYLYG